MACTILSEVARVLLVGHSLVGQDMPQMLEAVLPPGSEVAYQVIGGAPLEVNWKDHATAEGGDGRALLEAGHVDAVVLTEQIPVRNAVQWHDTAGYLARWTRLAQTHGPSAVWLYESWPNIDSGSGREIPYDRDGALPWRERLDDERAVWADAAAAAAGEAGVPVRIVPVGAAMGRLTDEIAAGRVPGITDIHQLFADDIHPNDVGFYFVTLVHYAALTGRSPVGLPRALNGAHGRVFEAPSEELAAALQRIAGEAVAADPAARC